MSGSGSERCRPLRGRGAKGQKRMHVEECGFLGGFHGVQRTLIPLNRWDTHIGHSGQVTVLGLQRGALAGKTYGCLVSCDGLGPALQVLGNYFFTWLN